MPDTKEIPFYGRDHRPIETGDINAAIRGLRLAGCSTKALLETFNTHIAIDLFASAVIAVGCARRLMMSTANWAGMLTDEQLAFVARYDRSEETQTEVAAEKARRDAAEQERAKGWLFEFRFERDYIEREGFTRIIRAPSLEEAKAAAANLADEFNHDCPDDCSSTDGGAGGQGFEAECSSAEVHRKTEPDYVVLEDGQCVPYES
jgi:hypothetical protein